MNLLVIDSATVHSVVALRRTDAAEFVDRPEPGPKHGRLLVPAIRALLDRADLRPSDLGAIGVGVGPGSFTGLRVGVTAAKTLAFAIGCPVVGLSSLEGLARNAPGDRLWVVAAIDAQRGDLFSASFRREGPNAPLRREGADQVISAQGWVDSLPEGAFLVCPTPDRIASNLPDHVEVSPSELARPDGSALLTMAAEAVASGRFEDLWLLEPHYLRRSAAEEKRDATPPRP